MKRLFTVLLACIVLAVMVSGCSGGNPTGTPGSTPTPAPTPGPASPAPTWTAVDTPSRIDQLFHLDSLHWYLYRSSLSSESVNLSSLYKFEYSDEVYEGTAAKHTRVTSNDTVSGLENVVDIYTSRADGRSLGGTVRTFIFGTFRDETGIPAGQGMNYLDRDLASQARASSGVALTAQKQETVTVDGTTYTCNKYVYTYQDATYTAWYTPQAPAPVKVTWTEKGIGSTSRLTLELLDWG